MLILNYFCKTIHFVCALRSIVVPLQFVLFLQGNVRTLVLMITSAAVGGTLQYGYNLAIMNAPTVVSKHERKNAFNSVYM